jgi:hypothetical protein
VAWRRRDALPEQESRAFLGLIVRECLDKPYFDDSDLANILANGPELAWLYGFLLGLAPLLIVRSRKLPSTVS